MTLQPDPRTWDDPHPRAQALSARGRGLAKLLRDDRLIQWLLYIGITPLNLLVAFPLPVVLLFLIGGSSALTLRLVPSIRRSLIDWPLYIYPAFGLLSTLWSTYPGLTFKFSWQVIVTILLGSCLARYSPPRRTILMLFVSVAMSNLLSLAYPNLRPDGIPTGIFGSKNNYAAQIAMLLLLAVSVGADRKQPFYFRIAAVVVLLGMPGLLIKAKSVGAILTIMPALMLMIAIMVSAKLRPAARYAVTGFSVVAAGISVPMLIAASGMSKADFLISLGKDPTLTGREVIWKMGWEMVREHPLLGRGFQAFWVQGNVDAEGIWNYAGIRGRMGFHFHNMYVETVVELGYIGLGIFIAFIVWLALRTLLWALREPSPATAFYVGYVTFTLSRTYAEVEFFSQFGTAMLLVCSIWAYSGSRPPFPFIAGTDGMARRRWRSAPPIDDGGAGPAALRT